jgi:hypothetical protein
MRLVQRPQPGQVGAIEARYLFSMLPKRSTFLLQGQRTGCGRRPARAKPAIAPGLSPAVAVD